RVASFGLPGLMNSKFTVYLGLATTGCMIVPIGLADSPSRIIETCEQLDVNVLLAMPTELATVIRELETTNRTLPRVHLVVTGGEPMWADLVARANMVLGNRRARFRSTFQTSQAGTIGFQCEHLDSNEYHLHEELQFVEIDPATTELVTTNLDRLYMPVI